VSKPQLTLLSRDDKTSLHERVVEVLEEVGIAFNSREALDVLAAADVPVDRERLSARIPRELVETCLAMVPQQVLLAGRTSEHDIRLGEAAMPVFTADGSATYVLDDASGSLREGTLADLRRFLRLMDALPEVDVTWSTVSPRDLDARTSLLEIVKAALSESTKHTQDGVRRPELVSPLIDILEAVAGAPLAERPLFSAIDCTIAPLQHDPRMTDACLDLVLHKVPIVVMPMPLSGTTAPMSLSGTCIVHLAELLSAVVLFQLRSPGCPLVASTAATVADMRTGRYLCAGPEKALLNLALTEMCKHYGLPTEADGVGSDAGTVDFQAGAEGMATGLFAALAGADAVTAFGCLGGAEVTSLAKLMLDCETVRMIETTLQEVTLHADSSVLDDIREVGIGGHYLGCKSTRRLVREGGSRRSGLFRRGSPGTGVPPSIVLEAAERAEQLIATSRAEPLDDDVTTYIDGIIREFSLADAD
jgi:trimethylamine---corrinoid protein Co-methyltransferase